MVYNVYDMRCRNDIVFIINEVLDILGFGGVGVVVDFIDNGGKSDVWGKVW